MHEPTPRWLPRPTRARTAGLALVAALLLPAAASAALLVYEPFDYADEAFLDGVAATGLNLVGDYAAIGALSQQDPQVLAPSLDYGSLSGSLGPLPAVAGNRLNDAAGVTAAGATVSVASDVLVGAGDVLFWSALFTFDDSLNGNHLANITFRDDVTGDELFFGEPGVGIGGLRVAAQTAGTGGSLIANGADNAFVDGHTLLLIGRYENAAAMGADLLQLLVYDTGDAESLPATFDPTDPNAESFFELSGVDIDFARIGEITFTIRGTDNNFIDELRIGDSYASVVAPEPSVAVLVGLALVILGSRRRPPMVARLRREQGFLAPRDPETVISPDD